MVLALIHVLLVIMRIMVFVIHVTKDVVGVILLSNVILVLRITY